VTRVPSYVVKAREFLRKQMIRETPALAEMARLRRALLRASEEHPEHQDMWFAAARVLEDALAASVNAGEGELVVIDAAQPDATPPLFPE